MFLQNKYTKIYYNIIDRALSRNIGGYLEKHHIVPRSLGGTDLQENLVLLTAREHFLCHLLLVRFTSGNCKAKMVNAAYSMIGWNKQKINSKTYECLKNLHSFNMKNNNPVFDPEVRLKISKKLSGKVSSFKGKKHTDQTKKKMSESSKGSVPWNKGLVGAQSSTRKGVPRSEEVKNKIRETLKRTRELKVLHVTN